MLYRFWLPWQSASLKWRLQHLVIMDHMAMVIMVHMAMDRNTAITNKQQSLLIMDMDTPITTNKQQ